MNIHFDPEPNTEILAMLMEEAEATIAFYNSQSSNRVTKLAFILTKKMDRLFMTRIYFQNNDQLDAWEAWVELEYMSVQQMDRFIEEKDSRLVWATVDERGKL